MGIRSPPSCCPNHWLSRIWPLRLRLAGIKASRFSLTLWKSSWSGHERWLEHSSLESPDHREFTPSCGKRQLAGCDQLLRPAYATRVGGWAHSAGQPLSSADGGGVGVRRSRQHFDTVQLRR